MTLLEQQFLFATNFGKLLAYADDTGIKVTTGECLRGKQQAEWNAAHDLGTLYSLHLIKLAGDLNCFRLIGGVWTYLSDGRQPEYKLLGNFWKALAPGVACWGGDFSEDPDWDHFSLGWQGRR